MLMRSVAAVCAAGLTLTTVVAMGGPAASATPNYQFNQPTGETVANGDVWVTNAGGDSVTEITPAGKLVRVLTDLGLDDPTAIATSNGNVWIANSASLTEVGAVTGDVVQTVSASAGDIDDPTALAVHDGDLYVVNGAGSVSEFDIASGALVAQASASSYGFSDPSAVVVAGNNLWVTNTTGHSVTELRAGTLAKVRIVSNTADAMYGADGISFDGTHLWVADSTDNAVTELSTAGEMVNFLDDSEGSYGFDQPGAVVSYESWTFVVSPPGSSPMITQVEDTTGAANWYMCNTNGPYEFALPTALAFDRGLIFVANSSGNSVTIMNSSSGAYVNRLT